MKKILNYLFSIVMLIFIPLVFILPMFIASDAGFISITYGLKFLIILIYGFPLWVILLGIINVLEDILSKKTIAILLAKLLTLIAIIVTFVINDQAIYLSIVFSIILLILFVVDMILSREVFVLFKNKTVWIISLVLVILVTLFSLFHTYFNSSKNMPDLSEPKMDYTS